MSGKYNKSFDHIIHIQYQGIPINKIRFFHIKYEVFIKIDEILILWSKPFVSLALDLHKFLSKTHLS